MWASPIRTPRVLASIGKPFNCVGVKTCFELVILYVWIKPGSWVINANRQGERHPVITFWYVQKRMFHIAGRFEIRSAIIDVWHIKILALQFSSQGGNIWRCYQHTLRFRRATGSSRKTAFGRRHRRCRRRTPSRRVPQVFHHPTETTERKIGESHSAHQHAQDAMIFDHEFRGLRASPRLSVSTWNPSIRIADLTVPMISSVLLRSKQIYPGKEGITIKSRSAFWRQSVIFPPCLIVGGRQWPLSWQLLAIVSWTHGRDCSTCGASNRWRMPWAIRDLFISWKTKRSHVEWVFLVLPWVVVSRSIKSVASVVDLLIDGTYRNNLSTHWGYRSFTQISGPETFEWVPKI